MFIGEQPDLLDLWVFQEDSIYVVGKDGIPQHYDGAEWLPVSTENSNPLMGIWASDENNIYAVGVGGVVLHYDGKVWTQIDTGGYDSLNAAYGFDSNNMFIYGVGGAFCSGTGKSGITANLIPFMICSACGERISITFMQ